MWSRGGAYNVKGAERGRGSPGSTHQLPVDARRLAAAPGLALDRDSVCMWAPRQRWPSQPSECQASVSPPRPRRRSMWSSPQPERQQRMLGPRLLVVENETIGGGNGVAPVDDLVSISACH